MSQKLKILTTNGLIVCLSWLDSHCRLIKTKLTYFFKNRDAFYTSKNSKWSARDETVALKKEKKTISKNLNIYIAAARSSATSSKAREVLRIVLKIALKFFCFGFCFYFLILASIWPLQCKLYFAHEGRVALIQEAKHEVQLPINN